MKQSLTFQPVSFIKLFLIINFIINFSSAAFTQHLYKSSQLSIVKADEYSFTSPAIPVKKRFWRAAGEWTMMQVLPWASNRYIRKAVFAKISIKSMGHNLNPKNLEWDDNKFFNNQFSHPYQGSLYFNAFRSNGYSFWESAPAALAGTFAWETIFETHVPAPNDLVNTFLGGIAIGEMSNRIAGKLLNRKKGTKRSRIAVPLSFVINPLYDVNYILDNKWKEKNEPAVDNTPLNLVSDAGIRLINIKGAGKKEAGGYKREAFGRIHLQYGDPFTSVKDPFSNFSITVEAGNDDSAKANILQIEGSLYGRKIKQTDHSIHCFTISMNYDLFQNSSFNYGAQSFRANLFSKFKLSENIQVQLKSGTGIIALAAVHNPYMYYGEGRNYDYCMGISFHAGAGINIGNKLFYNFNCNAAGVKTVNGYQSSHILFSTTSELRLVVYKNFSISTSTSNYYSNDNYKKYSSVSEHFQFRHVGLGYKVII